MYAVNSYNKHSNDMNKVNEFCEDYKDFISRCKTERLCVKEIIKQSREHGFKDINELDHIKPGDRFYVQSMSKTICLFVMGNKDIEEGMHILGAHIDSPRMDIKQNPLYEKDGFALMDTHYYGGIKKYLYVTIPLSLMGVIIKKDGTTVEVNIGENEGDPVFSISDLLIHLSGDLMKKTGATIVPGEKLDVIVGSLPLNDEKDAVKANVLNILKETYDIEEEDFLSAEIEVVPNGKARDHGFDRSMIMAYGQDDRVCAYTSFRALLDIDEVDYTACGIFVDKEEIGSVGATGAESVFFENAVLEILEKLGKHNLIQLRRTLRNSKALSSDVHALVDPLHSDVFDSKNGAYVGKGLVLAKFHGARGKSSSNDANPEFIAQIRKVFDEHNIHFQTAELGKVDQGGGGTISYTLANYNMSVIDAGVPILNMHAPYELSSKLDIYEGYLAYKAFIKYI